MRWIDLKARKRVDELQESLDSMKRRLQDIELEWNNVYDKLRSMMGRIAKRAERVENAPVQPDGGDSANFSGEAASPTFPHLTPHQRMMQLKILSRRKANREGAA